MREPQPEILDSWKAIAAYLNRDVRTAQRWEKALGLPVHRVAGSKLVFAHKSEVDAWLARQDVGRLADALPPEAGVPAAKSAPVWRLLAMAAVIVIGAGGALLWWLAAGRRPGPLPRVTPLTTYPGVERWPSFSPDGTRVAFAWDGGEPGAGDIYIKLIGPGEPVRLTEDGVEKRGVAWSPDGRHIAFVRGSAPARGGLYIIPALGGPERKITEAPGLASAWYSEAPVVAWSPDSRWLVVPERMPGSGILALARVSIDTGEKRRLTTPPQGVSGENSWLGDNMPAISPDGRFLAFRRSVNFTERAGYVVPLAGDLIPCGPPKRFSPPGAYVASVMWTPDSREILYLLDDILWSAPASGSGAPKPLPSAGHFASHSQLTISRKGDRLLYSDVMGNGGLRRVDLDGTKATGTPLALKASTRSEGNASVSPDGKRIAFESDRSGSGQIWVSGLDGSSPVQLTSFEGGPAGTPRWSPDGREIACDVALGGSGDLYVIDAAGGGLRRLTTDDGVDLVPSWSRDGKWVYFTSNRSGSFQMWKMPAGGGPAIQLTTNGGFGGMESSDGRWFYYAKAFADTSIWRIPVDGGEARQVVPNLRYNLDFAVARGGLYFVPNEESTRGIIRFYEFRTGNVHDALVTDEILAYAAVALSRDERFLVYSGFKQSRGDLMLVENFR